MTPLERAEKVIHDWSSCRAGVFPALAHLIQAAIVEATNAEVERRRAVEAERDRLQRVVDGLSTSEGVHRIATERRRHVDREGWTPEHDDSHSDESLAWAAVCYAAPYRVFREGINHRGHTVLYEAWPDHWSAEWDKRAKHSRLRRLEIAGSLIAAEIDRLCRAAAKEGEVGHGR